MNPILKFEFTVNKENNTIHIEREFKANLDLVWSAWTTPQLLDQWWAPKPYRTVTKSMNFTEGGTWLYAMISPKDEMHWCKADYIKIDPKKKYTGLDAFCDENGVVNNEFPRSEWNNTFNAQPNDHTLVTIVIQYQTLNDLEKIIELGFKEGLSMALSNLDQYFEG